MSEQLTPRTEREREAVVKLVRKAQSRAWDAAKGVGPHDWQGLVGEPEALVPYVAIAPRPTRLREYKGVTFRDGKWWYNVHSYDTAWRVIMYLQVIPGTEWTDADHAALLDLKANPTEEDPDAVVEELRPWVPADESIREELLQRLAATVRAIVLSEVDAAATVEELVAALVEKGAKRLTVTDVSVRTPSLGWEALYDATVLILPPEAP